MIWPHASKLHPCPVCGKEDWCTFGDRATLCQRIESDRPAVNGGWYHSYGSKDAARPLVLPKARSAPKEIDCERIMAIMDSQSTPHFMLARKLKVSEESISALRVGYYSKLNAWAFPMLDGAGKLIGIRLRNDAGFKWAVTGSRQGIFMPADCNPGVTKIAYLPEGPTDTAALLTMGLFAIGRPSCNGGNEHIKEALKRLRINKVVVVADNDGIKTGGHRPGLEGAIKLKKFLGLPSVIWMPPSPIKDAREFLNNGGNKQMIEAEIKNRVWSRV